VPVVGAGIADQDAALHVPTGRVTGKAERDGDTHEKRRENLWMPKSRHQGLALSV
jgi:hypothetical protein